MEQFLSTLLFVLPGLLGYYWIILFGLTPTQKHSSFEMIALSALLWVPVTFINLTTYNLIVFLGKSVSNLSYIYQFDQLQKVSGYLVFHLFYIVSSIIVSYILARFIVGRCFKPFLEHVNKIRVAHKLSELSDYSTVWEEFFMPYGKMAVEISHLDNPGEKIIGSLTSNSRPLEPERNLILQNMDYVEKLIEKYKIPVKSVFVDAKSGTVVKLFDQDKVEAALKEEGN